MEIDRKIKLIRWCVLAAQLVIFGSLIPFFINRIVDDLETGIYVSTTEFGGYKYIFAATTALYLATPCMMLYATFKVRKWQK